MRRKDRIQILRIDYGKVNKVIIKVPYNQKLINKVKTISGRRWDPQGKYWEVPYSEDLIPKLQSLFDENLVIDPYFHLSPLETEIYTHVSTKNLSAIKNPLDILLAVGYAQNVVRH